MVERLHHRQPWRAQLLEAGRSIFDTSIAVVDGLSAPYLATTPAESAFVPRAMFKAYGDMLQKQIASGTNPSPRLRTMAATGMTGGKGHMIVHAKQGFWRIRSRQKISRGRNGPLKCEVRFAHDRG